MNLHKKSVLATVGAVCALGMTAPHAQADSFTGPNGYITETCPGSVINSGKVPGHPTATWNLWYSSANGGTNCVKVYDNTGGSHFMEAMIRPAGNYHDGARDSGTFTTYAGGSAVKKMAGRCVGMTVAIEDNGKRYEKNVNSFHCG